MHRTYKRPRSSQRICTGLTTPIRSEANKLIWYPSAAVRVACSKLGSSGSASAAETMLDSRVFFVITSALRANSKICSSDRAMSGRYCFSNRTFGLPSWGCLGGNGGPLSLTLPKGLIRNDRPEPVFTGRAFLLLLESQTGV